jgi:hypothetical protein
VYNSETGGVELIDASTGTILAQMESGEDFAQVTFADNRIFTATVDGVGAWGVQPAPRLLRG